MGGGGADLVKEARDTILGEHVTEQDRTDMLIRSRGQKNLETEGAARGKGRQRALSV